AYIFYIDIRSGGKGYEEFVKRAVEEDGVLYLRGKVSKIFEENGKVKVWGVDTLSGKDIEVDADMVVLAMAMRPSKGAEELAKKLKKPIWICTSRLLRQAADLMGYTKKIEAAGGKVVADTCMVVSPLEDMGYKTTAVDSGKAANYLPGFCKQSVVFGNVDELIRRLEI
ncbi:DUF521 domain-containing protein, partial [bacterium]